MRRLRCALCRFPLRSSPSLLQKDVARVAQVAHLVALDALQPVAEAGAETAVDRVGPGLAEEGAHFDAELPEADCKACSTETCLISIVMDCAGLLGRGMMECLYRSRTRKGFC